VTYSVSVHHNMEKGTYVLNTHIDQRFLIHQRMHK